MLEMAAVTYDGAHSAERALSDLRGAGGDAWLSEVSVIEHDADGEGRLAPDASMLVIVGENTDDRRLRGRDRRGR